MTQDQDRSRQARGFERFLVITDGVVAITLLVVPLIEAVSSGEPDDNTAERILSSLGGNSSAFS